MGVRVSPPTPRGRSGRTQAEFSRWQGWQRTGSRLRHSPHVVGGRLAYIRTGPAGLAGARVAKNGGKHGYKGMVAPWRSFDDALGAVGVAGVRRCAGPGAGAAIRARLDDKRGLR